MRLPRYARNDGRFGLTKYQDLPDHEFNGADPNGTYLGGNSAIFQ